MFAEKIMPISYEDYNNFIINDLDKILDYENCKSFKFDCVIGKLKNEMFGANIIANYLGSEIAIIDIPKNGEIKKNNILFSSDLIHKLENTINTVNILFVNYMLQTEKELQDIKDFFNAEYKNINLVIYSTFALNNKDILSSVDIVGKSIDSLIQAPWERFDFTPQTFLDRLDRGSITTIVKNSFCIGLCSYLCEEDIKMLLPSSSDKVWYMIFQDKDDKVMTPSRISTHVVPSNMTLIEAKTKYKNITKEKIDFINLHGLTHFIESNLEQAILLSNASPLCHILFYTDNTFYNIFVREVDKNHIFINK